MTEKITINIDGKGFQAVTGETILDVALRNNIEIPNLCYNKNSSCTAACRVCIVKIEGRPTNSPSCATIVEDGMKISVFTEQLEAERKLLLDLILSTHNDDCINCLEDGACELQDLAFRYNLGRDDRQFPAIWDEMNKFSDISSQVLDYDAAKCIQCQRCLKACNEVQGKGILTFINRGIDTFVSTGYDAWNKSDCDGCGECIQSCPVGALTAKPVYKDGFRFKTKDLEKTVQTTCPYCGVGCQLDVSTIKDQIVKVDGSFDIPNFGSTCVKGRFGLDFASHKERITKPLIRKDGELIEVEWTEAISFATSKLKHINETYGNDSIAGLSSARCTNEDNFVFQKFMRSILHTNNVDHCARLCHSSTVAGLATTLGSGAMTNSIAELEHADVILVTGSNTTETHPVIATYIKKAVVKGAKLIVVDPRRIDLVRYSTLWLRQNNGTDVVWLNGFINVILNENLHDEGFIKERTEGFDELEKTVAKYTPELVEKITGIPVDKIIEAAGIYAKADKASIVFSMGITQHTHGTDNVKSVANLAMITGNLGKESTGVNPLRGQNNVQGACDMGGLPNNYTGYQKVTDKEVQKKFESAWKTELSDKNGLTLMEMMEAAGKGDLKAMYIMGENPAVSDANANHVIAALNKLDLLICQDIFLNETSQYADVVFPAASFAERNGTFTNTERRVLPINKIIEPLGESREDWKILQYMASAFGKFWNYTSVDDIMKEINLLTPQYGGITPSRMQKGERLQWPCPNKNHSGTKFLHKDKFVRGKGLLSAIDYMPPKELPDEDYPFLMSTGRMLFHYHTGTMTRRSKALNAYVKDAYFEMNIQDMEKLNVVHGEKVKVSSRRGEIIIPVKQSEKVSKGNIFIPFHFAEASANKLTLDKLDPISKIPSFKVCAAKIEKI